MSAAGWGIGPFRDALREGRSCIGTLDRFENAAQRTHIAGQVPPAPPTPRFPFRRGWNKLSNSDRFATYAAAEAVAQAGFTGAFDHRAGVFFGSSTGGLFESERYFEALMRSPDSPPRRSALASHLIGAPAEAVARLFGVQGPVETVSSACASAALAIEQALRAIRSSEIDVALAGGADCLCLTTYSGFNALRAVADTPCRPFRADRSGISLGEGGAVLTLESLEHALARGATPLAEILGAGSTCDANHMTAPQAEGEMAALAVERAISDADLETDTISFINAHGTGTPLNDVAECAALQRVFGPCLAHTPLEATKGLVGHLLGAAGVIAAVSVVLGLRDGEVHPVPGGGAVDPALPVDLVLHSLRPLSSMRAALSVSLGFGGVNAAVVFGRWTSA